MSLYVAVSVAANGELVPGPTLGMVSPGSPAAAAGLAPGDRIVAVTLPTGEVRTARWFSELRELVAPHPGRTLVLQIERDGARLPPISVVPARVRETNQIETVVRGVLGVGMEHPPALVAPVGPGPVRPLDLVVLSATDRNVLLVAAVTAGDGP